MSRWKRVAVPCITVGLVLAACGNQNNVPVCGGQTGVNCLPTMLDVSKMACVCSCDTLLTHSMQCVTFEIGLCLPTDINAGQTDPKVIQNKNPMDYFQELRDKCTEAQDHIRGIFNTLNLINPDACQQDFHVDCALKEVPVGNTKAPYAVRRASCDPPCTMKQCTPGGNCNDPRIPTGDKSVFKIDPTACDCDTVQWCDGSVNTTCRPSIGDGDPQLSHPLI